MSRRKYVQHRTFKCVGHELFVLLAVYTPSWNDFLDKQYIQTVINNALYSVQYRRLMAHTVAVRFIKYGNLISSQWFTASRKTSFSLHGLLTTTLITSRA